MWVGGRGSFIHTLPDYRLARHHYVGKHKKKIVSDASKSLLRSPKGGIGEILITFEELVFSNRY